MEILEILFKAKYTENEEWVEGLTLQHIISVDPQHEKCTFLTPNGHSFPLKIDPKTVCQYTGLTDRNGKKIFEGDIVKEDDDIGIVKFGKYDNGFHYGFYIEWHTSTLLRPELSFWNSRIDVIGNIFDNPELLG